MKAAIYARVSSDMQAEDETPILGQLSECQAYCDSKGWQVVDVYKDEGISGKTTDRPNFQRLLNDARLHKFGVIVTWKSNRIARNTIAYYSFKGILQELGIDFIAIKEPTADGMANAILEPVMAGISEFFSLSLGQDTLRGLKQLAKEGYATGGRPPKGYMAKREVVGLKRNGQPRFHVKWEPDPEWTGRVQLGFQMLIEGYSNDEIIQRTGIAKNKSSLCTLFRNPTYIGERVFNVHRRVKGKVVKYNYEDEEVIRVPESHEAIISREVFDRAQELLTKRRPAPGQLKTRRHDFILSGVLWCAKHDCPITGYGNLTHRYYACEARRRHKEECSLLKKEALDEFVLDILKERVFTREHIREVLEGLRDSARVEKRENDIGLSNLKRQIAKLETEINNLLNAVASGIDADTIAKPVAERRVQIAKIERDMESFSSKATDQFATLKVTDELVEELRSEHFKMMDSDDSQLKRNYIQSCVDRIKIKGGSVEIFFKIAEPPYSQLKVAGVVLSQTATISARFTEDVFAGRNGLS